MMRAQAIALGAGMTVLTFGFWLLIGGQDSPQASALTQFAAWCINLTLAEWFIQSDSRRDNNTERNDVGEYHAKEGILFDPRQMLCSVGRMQA